MRPLTVGVLIVAAVAVSCADPEKERAKQGIQPTYDTTTGKLTALTYDSNHNGTIDTWADMDGARPVETRIDSNEDGRIDRWEYYNEQGQLAKVGFSRKGDGKPDAWAFSGEAGRVDRIEISSTGDQKKIDRWEHYDATGLVSAEEDTNADGVIDKWETYQAGSIRSVAFDESGDGKADRRLTYAAGALSTIETAPDAAGKFTSLVAVNAV
ncbi:MAG: hypothetical protein ABJC89_22430, partial [Acidobacteriota bacterium]